MCEHGGNIVCEKGDIIEGVNREQGGNIKCVTWLQYRVWSVRTWWQYIE